MPLIITREQVQYFSVSERDFEVHISRSILFDYVWFFSFAEETSQLIGFIGA